MLWGSETLWQTDKVKTEKGRVAGWEVNSQGRCAGDFLAETPGAGKGSALGSESALVGGR